MKGYQVVVVVRGNRLNFRTGLLIGRALQFKGHAIIAYLGYYPIA